MSSSSMFVQEVGGARRAMQNRSKPEDGLSLRIVAALMLANTVETLAMLRREGFWDLTPEEMRDTPAPTRRITGQDGGFHGEVIGALANEKCFWFSDAPEKLFEWCETVLGGFLMNREKVINAAIRMSEAGCSHGNHYSMVAHL